MLSVTVHEKLAGVVVQICFVNILSFQFHAVTVTSVNNVLIIVLYCSSGLLGNFLEEMDMPLNLFINDPLTLLCYFNLPSDKAIDINAGQLYISHHHLVSFSITVTALPDIIK